MIHVLARAEADAFGADEALLVNTNGDLAEGTSCNLFWIQGDAIYTPLIQSGALPGITRNLVLEICAKLSIPIREVASKPDVLFKADGVFLSHTTMGVIEVAEVDGKTVARSGLVQTHPAKLSRNAGAGSQLRLATDLSAMRRRPILRKSSAWSAVSRRRSLYRDSTCIPRERCCRL